VRNVTHFSDLAEALVFEQGRTDELRRLEQETPWAE
jgi:hypothetical protein